MTTDTTTTVSPGDVFVESWGYDQTNVDAYVVTRVTKASVFLKPCGLEIVDGRVRPVPSRVGEFENRGGGRARIGRPNANGEIRKAYTPGTDWINMTSYSGARLWDGERTFYDTYAAGQPGH